MGLLAASRADLAQFVSEGQWRVMLAGTHGEEREYFLAKFKEFGERVASMPRTYGQDGKGVQAVAYLHYFTSSGDWYITERDSDEDGEGQCQAFGLADLGYGGELGYISIRELIKAGADLDLHFQPTTLESIIRESNL